jgi:hypothetical protein
MIKFGKNIVKPMIKDEPIIRDDFINQNIKTYENNEGFN